MRLPNLDIFQNRTVRHSKLYQLITAAYSCHVMLEIRILCLLQSIVVRIPKIGRLKFRFQSGRSA